MCATTKIIIIDAFTATTTISSTTSFATTFKGISIKINISRRM